MIYWFTVVLIVWLIYTLHSINFKQTSTNWKLYAQAATFWEIMCLESTLSAYMFQAPCTGIVSKHSKLFYYWTRSKIQTAFLHIYNIMVITYPCINLPQECTILGRERGYVHATKRPTPMNVEGCKDDSSRVSSIFSLPFAGNNHNSTLSELLSHPKVQWKYWAGTLHIILSLALKSHAGNYLLRSLS